LKKCKKNITVLPALELATNSKKAKRPINGA
jgi:hypothetical protein